MRNPYSNLLEDHLKVVQPPQVDPRIIESSPARARVGGRADARRRRRSTRRTVVMGSSEKTPKKEKRDDDGEDDSDGNGGGALRPTAPIARPLADLKTTKKILKVVKKGA